jgi:antitoxin HicB
MKQTARNKTLKYYLDKTYPVVTYAADEGGYVAEIEELPGCITQADSLKEVYERIEDARRAWIEVAYEEGMEITLPRTEQEYSGKFVIRLPKYMHRRLSQQAILEGVSLNQYVVSLLSHGLSGREIIMKGITQELNQQILEICTKMLAEGRGFRFTSLDLFPWKIDESRAKAGELPEFMKELKEPALA